MGSVDLLFLCLSLGMVSQPVFADVYDDIANRTHGSVTRMSREDIKNPSIQKETFKHFNHPAAAVEYLPNFSSHQSAWSLEQLKLKVISTGVIGAHAGWAYNKYSFEKMAKTLSPKDIPGLLELFSIEKGSTVGIQFALASQCQYGLHGVLMAVQDKTFHSLNSHFVDTSTAKEIIQRISNFELCNQKTKSDANKALKEF